MAKIKDAGAAPVSKYAARKAGATSTTKVEEKEIKETVEVASQPKEEVKDTKEVTSTVAHIATPTNSFVPKKNNINKKKSNIPDVTANYPEHFISLAMIIKNNAEIRRFTSIGILNYLLQKKEISGNNRFVSFKWNKFSVKCNGLTREYSYTETFFLNCLVAAFTSFSASAQRTINIFTSKELQANIEEALSTDEINAIANTTEDYLNVNN